MADGEGAAEEPRFLTEFRFEGGVMRARVFRAGAADPVALLAFVPTPSGRSALRELLRLAVEGGLGARTD